MFEKECKPSSKYMLRKTSGKVGCLQMTKKNDGAGRQGGHRSHDLSLIRRTLYPTELLGDVEVWRRV